MTVGALFRTMVMYKADRIFILDARDPERLRALIAAIFRQRHEQNLKREEELFFLLFEILRNPQLFAHITGSSLKALELDKEGFFFDPNHKPKRKTGAVRDDQEEEHSPSFATHKTPLLEEEEKE